MANVVITGSSKGIGFGLAREFARRGHSVMLAGSSNDSLDAAMEKLKVCTVPHLVQMVLRVRRDPD